MEPRPLPPPDPAPSLAARIGTAWRRPQPVEQGSARRLALILALVLPMGPLLTLAGAEWLSARARTAALIQADSPAARRAEAVERERREMIRLGAGSVAGTIEQLARAVPADDQLVSVAVQADRPERPPLIAEVATADPERLRAALSRDAATVGLRTRGERRGDGVLIVTVEGVQ